MSDLLAARRHFDRAMVSMDARYGSPDALAEFAAATEADPTMADAWLGRIACGDTSLETLTRLYNNGDWLHKETTRLGRHLAAQIPLGPYLSITVTDASHVGLALASALTVAGEYARADALLSDRGLLDSWINHQWHQLARAYLMFLTQRWPDLLTVAAEELPDRAIIMPAVTASVCALAAYAAAHLGQGRVALDWLDRVDIAGHIHGSDRFPPGVLTASIAPNEIPCWQRIWPTSVAWCTASSARRSRRRSGCPRPPSTVC